MKCKALTVVLLLGIIFPTSDSTWANDGKAISSAAVESSGLRVEWMTQIATGARGSIIDLYLDVNENNSTTFYEIDFLRGHEVISENDLDAFGEFRGIEGAQEYAELRKEIIEQELEAQGFDSTVTIQKYSLPETSLYSLTSDGFVAAVNGDTGKIRWTADIGTYRIPAIGIGANHANVAAVNGATLFCMDAATGKVLFTATCSSSPSSSPALSDEYIYVPLTNGRVEVFSIDGNGVGSERYVGSGRALSRPTVTEKSVSWSTTAGHLNVAIHKIRPLSEPNKKLFTEEDGKPKTEAQKAHDRSLTEIQARIRIRNSIGGISYRLRAHDEFVSSSTYKSGMLFVASLDGFVYAIDEAKGSIVWQFSTGEEIESSPIPIGNDLYIITSEHSLYKLDARTGAGVEGWDGPIKGVSEYVGASKDKIYVKDSRGNLVALGQAGGQRLGQVSARGMNLTYQNSQSDRLYIGTRSGLIQCLREVSSRIPYFHSADFASELVQDAKAGEAAGQVPEVNEDDPFAGFDNDAAANPEMTDDDNPFGGGAASDDKDDENPFGGGGAGNKKSDDPAGGGDQSDDDPFSGGGGL